jgi:hypothetical protein
LPDNQQNSAPADALRAIVELGLSELQAIEPPRRAVGTEQRDGPSGISGMGHDHARDEPAAPATARHDRASMPG